MDEVIGTQGLVAIVGRPNVGKSTLFNRLVQQRQAIVADQPGVTRDRNYGACHWAGRDFTVVDTGGYLPETSEVFAAAIREQVELALAEADVIIMVADGQTGLTTTDHDLIRLIRKHNLPEGRLLLAINKIDSSSHQALTAEFYALGLPQVYPISALSGGGGGELLDAAVAALPQLNDQAPELGHIPKLAVVGRPNVGKSSLVNAWLGTPTQIVTPIAGTTRDSSLTRLTKFGVDFFLIDTAGLRRRARVDDNVEYYSTLRTLRALEDCHIALLMIEATQGLTAQDLTILAQIERLKKPVVLLANKWDLVEKTSTADRDLLKHLQERLAPRHDIPVVLTSATEKTRLHKALQSVQEVYAAGQVQIPTRRLNEDLLPIITATPPPSHKSRLVRIRFITQVPGRVPTFLFFSNYPEGVKESYQRFLEGHLRKLYGFSGWPLNLFFREKD